MASMRNSIVQAVEQLNVEIARAVQIVGGAHADCVWLAVETRTESDAGVAPHAFHEITVAIEARKAPQLPSEQLTQLLRAVQSANNAAAFINAFLASQDTNAVHVRVENHTLAIDWQQPHV